MTPRKPKPDAELEQTEPAPHPKGAIVTDDGGRPMVDPETGRPITDPDEQAGDEQ